MMMEDDMIIYNDKMYNWKRCVWNEWGDLKCLQKPTNQMELMEAYFQTLNSNADEMRW